MSRTGSRIILVDTEATGASPFSSVMTEFGAVCFESRRTFHGVLFDSMPHPDTPALPVLSGHGPGPRYQRDTDPKPIVIASAHHHADTDAHRAEVYRAFAEWLDGLGGNPQFWSDNPAFDWQWLSFGFDQAGMVNPFGFSARRIGDLAAGLSGNWRKTSNWKRWRVTKHDHTPVNDSLGNAEALATLLAKHNQSI